MIIHNQTEAPVKDYPIQNPKTKEVHLWSILPGQTLEFPDYAGEYLLEIYRFLQRVVTKEERQAEVELQKKVSKGQQFSRIKIVEAPRKIIDKPMTQPGFTNEAAKKNAPTPQELNPRPVAPPPAIPPIKQAPPVEQPVPQPETQVPQQPTTGGVVGVPTSFTDHPPGAQVSQEQSTSTPTVPSQQVPGQ